MIEEFKKYRLGRHQAAATWKEQNEGKVLGTFCCCVPEEIIHAAGMLPVRIMGEHEETTEANLHFPTNLCPYCKSCFDQALKGRYDYLDGLVIPNVCNMIKTMYGFSKHLLKIPYIHFLDVPQRMSNNGVEFFTEELLRFKESLEDFSGKQISNEAIRHSIAVYNENRTLLSQAYELRKKPTPLISGSEAQEIVISSMLMPKEEHNRQLAQLLQQIENRNDSPEQGVRLFVSASILDSTDFLQLIEECGGNVVADDMPMGSRYFSGSVDLSDDPLHALADRYLNKIACPRKMLPDARLAFVTNMMKEADVKGVIIHNMRACDPHLYEYPLMKEKITSEGLPVLFFRGVETEGEQEQQRADIETFIEMLKG
ncbi:MAG: 2-hydroxyacyl-CoA dehydratase family protein [Chloroflexota bacterium]